MTTTVPCQWFVLCTNDATHRLPHPILGNVPICERCATAVASLDKRIPLLPIAGVDTETV